MMSIVSEYINKSPSRQERFRRYKRSWLRLARNKLSLTGFLMVLSIVFVAIFAPYLAPYPEDARGTIHFDQVHEPPSEEHLMGTDNAGRDVLSRLLFGARISLMMGVVVLSIALSLGISLGLIAGYIGGWINTIIMRVVDVFLSIPPILLPLAISASLEPSLTTSMVAIGAVWWTWYARLVQGEALSVSQEEFVIVSESIGASTSHIIFREILPNIISPITVKATLDMGFVILIGMGLAFLGLGANPPTPDWGVMIAQGRNYISSAWWVAVFPGLAISYTVLAFNLLGDGLRDIFDVEVE